MKLIEALKFVQSPLPVDARRLRVFLACGFTPLHLQTFLSACLRSAMPDCAPEMHTGLFGDLIGNVEKLEPSETDVLVVALEWTDLDPRLGIRTLGGWKPQQVADIVISAESAAGRLRQALEIVSRHTTTIVSLPTLPLPPVFSTRPLQESLQEIQLHRILAQLSESLAALARVRILNTQALAQVSAPAARYDLKSDVLTGFPYTLSHASAMGELLAALIENRPPLKGLITDLDDTLWAGIVGEDGVDGVSWHLDKHSQIHGVYQQALVSLAGAGVLIGVASKNDASVVEKAFDRKDMILSRDDVFPFEVHWNSKAASIGRILSTWNIGADAVVFIDDTAAEVAEVQAAYPAMKCRLFPKKDPAAVWNLICELRDLFGKPVINEEDRLRLGSIRNAATWRQENDEGQASRDEFLRSADARIFFEQGRVEDERAFELINKTNQFNLNGKRYTEAEWRQLLSDPTAFLVTATYEDKFGPLGKVAVLFGNKADGLLQLRGWVMSCRAFSRRIEHQCLRYLFEEIGGDRVHFDYQQTPRNGPVSDFLKSFVAFPNAQPADLSKQEFAAKVPQLFHQVEVGVDA